MTERMRRRLGRLAAGAALVLLALLVAGYGTYRVTAFARDTFRPDTVSARGARPDPETPTTGAPAPAPTPVTLGYAASASVARLRAGRPLTILLLGYGGAGHGGASLTDSLEVARLDPASGAVTLLSVPRDLWVRLPTTSDGRGGTWGTINAAYALGVGDTGDFATGGALASRAVAQVLGIPIDYRIGLDFVGFRQVIDVLGEVRDLVGWAQEQAAAGCRARFGTRVLDTTALLAGATAADGQAILLPTAGRGDYGAIRAFVRQLLATPAPAGS